MPSIHADVLPRAAALVLLLALAPAKPAHAQSPGALVVRDDVRYGLPGQSYPDQRLDLYTRFAPGAPPAPVVVHVHGGGFTSGDETIDPSAPLWDAMLERGWAIASVQHRLAPSDCSDVGSPDHPSYPGMVNDLALAIQFLRKYAQPLGLDPKRIGIYGKSAGGGLATWVALADDRAGLADGTGHGTAYSTRVRAVWNGGPTDWTYANPHPG